MTSVALREPGLLLVAAGLTDQSFRFGTVLAYFFFGRRVEIDWLALGHEVAAVLAVGVAEGAVHSFVLFTAASLMLSNLLFPNDLSFELPKQLSHTGPPAKWTHPELFSVPHWRHLFRGAAAVGNSSWSFQRS